MKKFLLFFTMLFAMVFMANAQQYAYEAVIGSGTDYDNVAPYYSLWNYSFVEMLYYNGDVLNAIGGVSDGAGVITSISFYLAESYTEEITNHIEVYMNRVNKDQFSSGSDFVPVTSNNKVFDGDWTIPANYTGWLTIELDRPFTYDSFSSLMIGIHENTPGYSTRNFRKTDVSTNRVISCYTDIADMDPTDPSTYPGNYIAKTYIPHIKINMMGCGDWATHTWVCDGDFNDSFTGYGVNGTWVKAPTDNHNIIAALHGENSMFIAGSGLYDYDYWVSPKISFHGAGFIYFAYATPSWSGDQNDLTVCYSTSSTGPWTSFGQFDEQTSEDWEQGYVDLTGFEGDYYIAFASYDGYGYCTALDNILIYAPEVVDNVNIGGFSEPVYGQHLDFDVTSGDEDLYHIGETGWYHGGEGYVSHDHIVQNEAYYYMKVYVRPMPGQYIKPGTSVVYFNGDASICDSQYDVIEEGQFRTLTINFYPHDGVNDIAAQRIGVYPNPANDVIYINGLENATEVSIYNAVGALVKVVNTNESINISDLSAGLYIAKFGENVVRFTKE